MSTSSAEQQFLAATKAAADPLRANILKLLRQESFGVLELAHILDTSQPTLSHHLKVLARGGLVASRRDGNSIFYRRALVHADCPMAGYLDGLFCTLDALPVDANADPPSDGHLSPACRAQRAVLHRPRR